MCDRFFKIYIIEEDKVLMVLPNKSDNGKSGWQPSLREYANQINYKLT